MSDFYAHPVPKDLTSIVRALPSHGRLRQVVREIDPFLLDNDCLSPQGHQTIMSCGEVVCPHCSKVFWS